MSDPKNTDPKSDNTELTNNGEATPESETVPTLESQADAGDQSKDVPILSNTVDAEPEPEPTPEPQPTQQEPQPAPAAAPVKVKKSKLWIPVFFNFLLTLALIGGIAYGVWMLFPQMQQQWQQQQQALAAVEKQQAAEKTSLAESADAINDQMAGVRQASDESLAQAQQLAEEMKAELRSITERLNAHNQRLLSLSNTSREDWMLAEANYLLRLASQRLLVDRQATSALGLMEAVDDILQELAMPDLFSVRQALARDLGAVRLAAEVDREGIYLRLDGLIHNMEQLPLYQNPLSDSPTVEMVEPESVDAGEQASETAEPEMGTWPWAQQYLDAAGDRLSQYFVLKRHDQPQSALIAPTQESYLRQNVRLSLESAQVAMLREQNEIYAASLGQAIDLVQRYFPETPASKALIEELTGLEERPIAVDLPHIDNSIEQLEAYIERLHQLAGSGEEP